MSILKLVERCPHSSIVARSASGHGSHSSEMLIVVLCVSKSKHIALPKEAGIVLCLSEKNLL